MMNDYIVIAARAALIAVALPTSGWAQTACDDARFHALDFWIGEWRVFNGDEEVARSVISREAGNCAIREDFDMPPAEGREAYLGDSISGFDSRNNVWRQLYIDSAGHLNVWQGAEIRPGELVFVAPGRGNSTQRMTYRLGASGEVEQVGEYTTDEGATWQPGYRYVYRPAVRP